MNKYPILKRLFLVTFLLIFGLTPLTSKSQSSIGFSISAGLAKISGNGNTSQSLAYGYLSSNYYHNIIPSIGFTYKYKFNNWLSLNSGLILNFYASSYEENVDDYDPHYPAYQYLNKQAMEMYNFGVPLNCDLKYKKTHLILGLSINTNIDGSYESIGRKNIYEFIQGYITTEWDIKNDYKLFGIIMYGCKIAVSQEINQNNIIEISTNFHKLKAMRENHHYITDKSFELNIGYYHYF